MTATRRLAAILAADVAKVCFEASHTGRANRELT
jgi:hypothetical protein